MNIRLEVTHTELVTLAAALNAVIPSDDYEQIDRNLIEALIAITRLGAQGTYGLATKLSQAHREYHNSAQLEA